MEYFDLKVYFSKLLKNWLIIVLCCVIGACSMFIYSKFFVTPMYASSAKMSFYDSNSGVSIGNVEVSYELIENSLVVLKDDITFEKVADIVNEEMDKEYTARQIADFVSYTRDGETFFVKVNVVTPDAELSAVICNAIIAVAPEHIVEYVANVPVKSLDDAKVNYTPVSPDITKNVLLGFLAGLVLVCGSLFLIVYFDKTISDEEKFKEKYDISILGVVPNFESLNKKHV